METWPCRAARTALTEAVTSDVLIERLLWLMATAEVDLKVAPAHLYRRFVGWNFPDGTACRVCGRAGHDVLPGQPPRLFPCKGQTLTPLRQPIVSSQQADVADLGRPSSRHHLHE
jgi:hypothetical protein